MLATLLITSKWGQVTEQQEDDDMLIPTTEAMKILEVESTQAVVQLANRHKKELPMINVGSEKQPRWLLRKGDVKAFQAKRGKGDIS